MKDINQLKNKADWLVQNRNKEMRLNINKEEIDWNKTFEFIILRQDETTMETTTKIRRINKQSNQGNINKCIRCKVKNENWNHVWECEQHKTTLYDIVQDNIKRFIENLKLKNIKVNEEKWSKRIIRILLEKSTIKENQLIIHECIKGIFNKSLLDIDNNKEIRQEMVILIKGIALALKEKIWKD
ncbi:hypothetical protein C1645_834176 [Glomus cerebriforme]|uniref:Reverse transcriptase zinc-binding domain-containing protein n=1 Tax=Glomus cerebriforme TaxID=658196 RepID=A0A397SG31_9GLOM|nr:hypothetical protein C1645_834176 [Glomus cerebriforme]